MQEILSIIHKTIYQFFDVCEDDEEVPLSDKDKLLLEVNKAICNNLKALEQEPKWIPVSERLPEQPYGCLVTVEDEEPMTGQWFENILPYFVGWDGERWNDSDGEQCPFEVIAWMPLPNVYRNGE